VVPDLLQFPHTQRPVPRVSLWDGPGRPQEAAVRDRLAAEGYQAVRWTSEPGQCYLPHAHIYTEVLWLLAGSHTVLLPADRRLFELLPGDRIEIPAGMLHASLAGPDGSVYLVATR
jgi:quercetin dioxygenase-like cupin family protein